MARNAQKIFSQGEDLRRRRRFRSAIDWSVPSVLIVLLGAPGALLSIPSIAAAQPTPTPLECCECPNPACGPPSAPGTCDPGCVLMPGTVCQGSIGKCVTLTPTRTPVTPSPTRTPTISATPTHTHTPTRTPTPTQTLGGFVIDHYKCYRAVDRSTPDFDMRDAEVTLMDQFGSKGTRVLRPELLCNPARKDLFCQADGDCPGEAGLCQLTQGSCDRRGSVVCQDDADCIINGSDKGPCILTHGVCLCAEDVDCPSGQTCVLPAGVCDSESIRNVDDHLVCYRIVDDRPREKPRTVGVRNQFGHDGQIFAVGNPKLVCVPSRKTPFPTETATPVPTPTETPTA